MICLGNELRSFCCFWDCTQVLCFLLLLAMRAIPLLLRYSCLENSMNCIVHGSWKVWHDWASFTFILIHFSSLIPKMSIFNLAISCLTTFNLPWFIGPGSYEILFVTALEFTSITIHLHNWASFLLWPSRFILSGAISNCPLLFPSNILDSFWPGGLIFWCLIFLPFHNIHEVFLVRILESIVISSSN